jgi:glycosyltransferase involved in cell wall biosynthesis
MKVLHLNNEKSWRGGERQTLLLALALARRGVENCIGCRPGLPLAQSASEAGVPTIPLSGNPMVAVAAIARSARRFDIVHCHTGRTHSLAALAHLLCRKPIVATRRVAFPVRNSAFNRFNYRVAGKVVGISDHIARGLVEWGLPAEKVEVIHSAVPLPRSSTTPETVAQLRTELRLPAGRRIIGNIASLTDEKDHATLLRAAREVADQHQDVVFVMIGGGNLQTQLLQQRQALKLDGTVVFTGFLPQAERFLPAFDGLVVCSVSEGLGSIILDAFAAGVPVVATAAGGIPELVRDGETGLLAPVGNASALAASIMRLLDNRLEAQQCAENAKKWMADEFFVDRMADRYLRVYDEVLNRR